MINKWLKYLVFIFIIYVGIKNYNTSEPSPISPINKSAAEKAIENQSFTPTDYIKQEKQSSLQQKEEAETTTPKKETYSVEEYNKLLKERNRTKESAIEHKIDDKESEIDASYIEKKATELLRKFAESDLGKGLIEKVITSKPMNKQQRPFQNNTIKDIINGEGKAVECGQTVQFHYAIVNTSGEVLVDTKTSGQPITTKIGFGNISKVIEYALIGMKKGGTRQLIVPPTYSAAPSFSAVTINMINALSEVPNFDNDNFQIFDQDAGNYIDPKLCGQAANINVNVKNVAGVIIDSKQVKIIIGAPTYPYGLSKVVEGLVEFGKRVAVVPADSLKVDINNMGVNIFKNLPTNQLVILEIEDVLNKNKTPL